ncbi:hypothetical protein BCA37_25340 [Mycobacterium sp. djl-10]|nr:hypothetical protein BCA37_25340 [Mycobacterium sp. djl-10]
MTDDWTLRPGTGLGRLLFGMSPTEVDAHTDVYGAVEARVADRASDDLLHETLALFGDGLSDEDKQAFIAAYAEHGPSSERVTETRKDSGLVLGYLADRLVEIMVPAHCSVVLEGHDLLSLGAGEALALLERANDGPGRYAATEAAFDGLALSLDGFCVTDPAAGVRILDSDDERFPARTVMARSAPYAPENEIARFRTHSVL